MFVRVRDCIARIISPDLLSAAAAAAAVAAKRSSGPIRPISDHHPRSHAFHIELLPRPPLRVPNFYTGYLCWPFIKQQQFVLKQNVKWAVCVKICFGDVYPCDFFSPPDLSLLRSHCHVQATCEISPNPSLKLGTPTTCLCLPACLPAPPASRKTAIHPNPKPRSFVLMTAFRNGVQPNIINNSMLARPPGRPHARSPYPGREGRTAAPGPMCRRRMSACIISLCPPPTLCAGRTTFFQ